MELEFDNAVLKIHTSRRCSTGDELQSSDLPKREPASSQSGALLNIEHPTTSDISHFDNLGNATSVMHGTLGIAPAHIPSPTP